MSDNRELYSASRTHKTNLAEPAKGAEEGEGEGGERRAEIKLLRLQLSLEEQLQSVCQELLQTYKESRDWSAVSQLAQSLITNAQRVGQINEQLAQSSEFSPSLPPRPLLESIQESELGELEECEQEDQDTQGGPGSEEKPVKWEEVEAIPTPTTVVPDKEGSEEVEEEARSYNPSKGVSLSQNREGQQTEESNNSVHPVLAVVDITERSPSPDFEVESSEDEFQTPEETTPERSIETSELFNSDTVISEDTRQQEDLNKETEPTVEADTEFHSAERCQVNFEDRFDPDPREQPSASSRDNTLTPEPPSEEEEQATPDKESSEGVFEAATDSPPNYSSDPRGDSTLLAGSCVISGGGIPESLSDNKLVKQDPDSDLTAAQEPPVVVDQLEQSGSSDSLTSDLLEVDKFLSAINQEEFTVDSVQPVAAIRPPSSPHTVEEAPELSSPNEDPESAPVSNQEESTTKDEIDHQIDTFTVEEEATPALSAVNEEEEASSDHLQSQLADSKQEDPVSVEGVSTTLPVEEHPSGSSTANEELKSLGEMDPYSAKYTVSKVLEPQSGQVYYKISTSESQSAAAPVLHSLEEFHSLIDSLKLDPFALDISYPDSEAQNDGSPCSNCDKLTAFLNRCVTDPNLSSQAELHEFLSVNSTTISATLDLTGIQASSDSGAQPQPSLNGEEGLQSSSQEEDSSSRRQPQPEKEKDNNQDEATPQVLSGLPQETEGSGVSTVGGEGDTAQNGTAAAAAAAAAEISEVVEPHTPHEESTSACTTPDVEAIIKSSSECDTQEGGTTNQSVSPADPSTPTPDQEIEDASEKDLLPAKEEDTSATNPTILSPTHSGSPSTASSSTNITTTSESSFNDLITRSESNPTLGGFGQSDSVVVPEMFMSLQPMGASSAGKSASSEDILRSTTKAGGKVKRQGSVPSIFAQSVKQRGQKFAKGVRKTVGKTRTSTTLQTSPVSLQKVKPTMEWDPTCLLEELYSDRRPGVSTKSSLSGEIARHFGYLEKLPVNSSKPSVMKGYKRRYFRAMEGKLYYYEDRKSEKALGFAKLTASRLVLIPKKCQLQVVEKSGKFIVIKASNNDELNSWHRALTLEANHATAAAPLSPTATTYSPPNQVLIIDIGACSVRAGFSSDDPYPEIFFPAVCSLDATTLEPLDSGCGNDALLPSNRCNAHLVYPRKMSARMDKNNSFLRLRAYQCIIDTIVTILNIEPQFTRVILTLSPTVPVEERNDLAELLFESFAFSGVCFQEQALLALYSYNTTSGIIVDIGDHIDIVPIIDGYAIEASITRLPFGGNAITESLSKLITSKGVRYFSETEQYINRFIKESICFVSQDIEKDNANCESNPTDYLRGVDVDRFNLPDLKKMIHLDNALFRAPEGLFDPRVWGKDVQGIHEYVWKAIQACPIDHRKDLAKNIYLSGATTLLPGLKERLQMELSALAPQGTTVTVTAGPSRQHAAYLGASVLAHLGSFQKILVTQEEWGAVGIDALNKWNVSSSE